MRKLYCKRTLPLDPKNIYTVNFSKTETSLENIAYNFRFITFIIFVYFFLKAHLRMLCFLTVQRIRKAMRSKNDRNRIFSLKSPSRFEIENERVKTL